MTTDPACICQFWSGPPPHPGCSVHGKMPPLSSNPLGSDASLRSELDRLAKEHGGYVSDIMEWASLRNKGMADEIERLTAELATMREAHGTYVELYPKVCIERDRLRAALEQISRVDCYGYLPQCECITCIAREALAGAPDETSVGPFRRKCTRCGKDVFSAEPITATVVYCSIECAD